VSDEERSASEEEPAHLLGMEWRSKAERLQEAEGQHVLGVPQGWIHPPSDFAAVRHPLRWLKWRREVRRKGPFAPDLDESPTE